MKVAQSCLTLCNPTDYKVHGILQVRMLKWIAFPFSRGSSWPRNWTGVSHIAGRSFFFLTNELSGKPILSLSHVQLFLTPWTEVACQAFCPWDFPGKNTGVNQCSLLQEIFLTQGLNLCLLHWQTGSLPLSHQGSLAEVTRFSVCLLEKQNSFPSHRSSVESTHFLKDKQWVTTGWRKLCDYCRRKDDGVKEVLVMLGRHHALVIRASTVKSDCPTTLLAVTSRSWNSSKDISAEDRWW